MEIAMLKKLTCGLAALMWMVCTTATAQDIVIGQSAPLTGGNAATGNDIRNGALAYFKKINDAGGINGRKIKLITLDDRNDAKVSGENAKQLAAQGAVAFFGFASATLSLPAMPTVKANRMPFFAPFTGADTIRKQGEFVYTTRVTYADEIDKLINFWAPLGVTKVLVLHYDDEVGKQNFETVERALKKYNKVPSSLPLKRNTDVSAEIVKKIVAADPQIILATTLAAPIVQIGKQLRAQNRNYSITSLSFASLAQLTTGLGADAAGITVALTVPPPDRRDVPIVEECIGAWVAAGQTTPLTTTSLEACLSAKVLVEGMRRTRGEVTRDGLQRALSSMGRINVGGVEIAFRPGFNHGGTYVDIAIIRKNGELRI
jgi:branched-chain amino acid transport system substrate-binding protein